RERRSGERQRCQFDSISRAILRWRDPSDRLRLVLDRSDVAPSSILTSSGIALLCDDTLRDLEAKHPYAPPPILPSSMLAENALSVKKDLVLSIIHSFHKETSCDRDGLRAQHLVDILGGAASTDTNNLFSSITGIVNLFLNGKCPSQLGEFIASAPLTPLVKPGGGIWPIAVGMVWRRLVSKLARLYYNDSILWSCQGVQQGDLLGPLLFALALHPLVLDINRACELDLQAWYLDDGTIVGDKVMVTKAFDIIKIDGPARSLFLNVDKTELFWLVEDPRSRVEGVLPPNISRPHEGVKLLGGPVSLDVGFCHDLVLKRVSKTIELMEAVNKQGSPMQASPSSQLCWGCEIILCLENLFPFVFFGCSSSIQSRFAYLFEEDSYCLWTWFWGLAMAAFHSTYKDGWPWYLFGGGCHPLCLSCVSPSNEYTLGPYIVRFRYCLSRPIFSAST
ncbi:hypothetical protein V2J09_000419, partial [Rumex salicifolius]